MTTAAPPTLNLRRHQIAEVLNVCLNEADRLIRNKAFPSFKIGGTRLARFEDVKAYNDSLAEGAVRSEPTRIAAAGQSAATTAADEPASTAPLGGP